jgi:hypothetical protein
LIKYHDVQSKIKSLKNSKKPILRYLSIRKAKKALILVLKKTKDAIFRWVTSSLEKYGMCKTHQAGFVSGVV